MSKTEASAQKPKIRIGLSGEKTLNDFEADISHALMNDDVWVETTPEIMAYFNRNGMGGARHFIYKGIKVCLPGDAGKIEAEESKTAEERIHGTKPAQAVTA